MRKTATVVRRAPEPASWEARALLVFCLAGLAFCLAKVAEVLP